MSDTARTHVRRLALLAALSCWPGVALAQREAESLSASFRKAAQRALPSVVAIRAPGGRIPATMRPGPPGMTGLGVEMVVAPGIGGSGIVIDAQRGLILTTRSAVARLPRWSIVFADGREVSCQRVFEDLQSDLAVLSIDPKAGPLSAVEWGDSQALRLGDWVLAIGRPSGTTQAVSAGIVSGRDASGAGSIGAELGLIRSDVRTGASTVGGPLINLAGQVVGINRVSPGTGMPADGFSHAIPAEWARRVASDLVEHGSVRRGYLGLTLGPGEAAPGDAFSGLIVTGIAPSSPAAEAGFRVGDRIVALDGRPVSELEGLARAVEAAPVGQEFRIAVERGGKRVELAVRSRPRPEAFGAVPAPGILPGSGPRLPDRRLRPRQRPRDLAPQPETPRRDRPLESEGPDDPRSLPAPLPPADRPSFGVPGSSG
jgi:S1-C subfamily serine protease